MSEKFTYDVFISYSSQDKAIVHPLAERLRDDGVKVWLDDWVLQPGDPISLKIQQGLENARVLLMCMSKAYFASDWTTFEHHTLLFRDPTNQQRRFVPLLLEECERPDVIAQFLHIDWQGIEDASYSTLIISCRLPKPIPLSEKAKQYEEIEHSENYFGTIEDAVQSDAYFSSIAIAADGSRAITGSPNHTLNIWDLEKQSLIASLVWGSRTIASVAISSDGQVGVAGSIDGSVAAWNLAEERQIAGFLGHAGPVSGVTICRDDRLAITGSEDGYLKAWNLDTCSFVGAYDLRPRCITAIASSSDGEQILAGTKDGRVTLWNLSKDHEVFDVPGHSKRVNGVAVSADGRRTVTGSSDSTLKIWDFGQTGLIATLEEHRDAVGAVALTEDGLRAFSVSSDNTLKIWDLLEGCPIATIEAHSSPIYGFAMSVDGRWAVSASMDRNLKTWDLTSLEPTLHKTMAAQRALHECQDRPSRRIWRRQKRPGTSPRGERLARDWFDPWYERR